LTRFSHSVNLPDAFGANCHAPRAVYGETAPAAASFDEGSTTVVIRPNGAEGRNDYSHASSDQVFRTGGAAAPIDLF